MLDSVIIVRNPHYLIHVSFVGQKRGKMTNPPLSPSRIDLYLKCPAAYDHYTKGTTQRPSSNYHIGSCCHNALEVYVDSVNKETNSFDMTLEEAMDYAISFVEPFKPYVIRQSLDILEKWIDNLPKPESIIHTEMRFGPPGTKVRNKPLHEETDFNDLRIQGIVDIIWEDGDTIVVGDYKTSREYLTPEELGDRVQAQLYAAAVHNIVPERPLRIEFYMLRYPENGPVTWEPDDYGEIESRLLSYQKRIHSDKTCEPTPGDNCKWCSYNYCCTAFKHWAFESPNGKMWHNMNLIELMNQLDVWFAKYISTKRVVDEIKGLVQTHMERENMMEAGNWKITRKAYSDYDSDVKPLIAEYGGITKCPKQLRIELENYKKTNWGKPYLKKVSGW